MAVTLKELAKICGVSVGTVSKILNGKDADIGDATRTLVRDAARQYHYRPNALARSLVTKRAQTIGLLVPDISNAFFAMTARGVEDGAVDRDYAVILCNTDEDPEKERRYIRALNEKQVDGIVMTSVSQSDFTLLRQENDGHIPLILLDRPDAAGNWLAIHPGNRVGGAMAARRLIAGGHRRIGCITGPLGTINARRRLEGYCQALEDAGIPYDPSLVYEGDYRIGGGEAGAAALIARNVTAVFACNDLMAVGVYHAAQRLGIPIPGGLSVVGFDDTPLCEAVSPPMTTIHQPAYEMGRAAAQALLALIQGRETDAERLTFSVALRERGSVGPPAVSRW